MALKHVLLITAVAGLVLGVPVILATGAFSSATLEREATVNVASDSEGLLALIDGHPNQDIVVEESDGTLAIDLTPGDAAGVNQDGTFLIGSETDPSGDHAFEIQNQGTRTVSITMEYVLSGNDPDPGTPNVKFMLYESGPPPIVTASEGTSVTVPSVDPGSSVYAVIEIDTKGISNGNDLSGALDISAG